MQAQYCYCYCYYCNYFLFYYHNHDHNHDHDHDYTHQHQSPFRPISCRGRRRPCAAPAPAPRSSDGRLRSDDPPRSNTATALADGRGGFASTAHHHHRRRFDRGHTPLHGPHGPSAHHHHHHRRRFDRGHTPRHGPHGASAHHHHPHRHRLDRGQTPRSSRPHAPAGLPPTGPDSPGSTALTAFLRKILFYSYEKVEKILPGIAIDCGATDCTATGCLRLPQRGKLSLRSRPRFDRSRFDVIARPSPRARHRPSAQPGPIKISRPSRNFENFRDRRDGGEPSGPGESA